MLRMKSTGLTTRCFSPVQKKPAKADFFCFRKNCGGAADFSPAVRQAAKPPIGCGACGVRKSSRRGCVGASPPQRKAPQGVKKARRRKRGYASERRRRLSGCAFFGGRTAGRLLRGGCCGFCASKKISRKADIFLRRIFFIMPQKALGYTPPSKV